MDRPFCLGDQRRFFTGDSKSVVRVIDFFGPTTCVAANKEATSRDRNMDSLDVVVGEFPRIVRHRFGGRSVFVWGGNGQDQTLALRFVVVDGGGSNDFESVRGGGFSGGVESFPWSEVGADDCRVGGAVRIGVVVECGLWSNDDSLFAGVQKMEAGLVGRGSVFVFDAGAVGAKTRAFFVDLERVLVV